MNTFVLTGLEAQGAVENWKQQLADLFRKCWTGSDGRCYYPFHEFTNPNFWENSVSESWKDGRIYSWLKIDSSQNPWKILAHCSLVKKGSYWELGRAVSDPNAPRWSQTEIAGLALQLAEENGWQVMCEATQCNTASQFVCQKLGLRFAGIGFLKDVRHVSWDIIYFDNLRHLPAFQGKLGIVGNPLGQDIICTDESRDRLTQISNILSCQPGGRIPPFKFHVSRGLLPAIQRIISLNTGFGSEARRYEDVTGLEYSYPVPDWMIAVQERDSLFPHWLS